MLIAFLAYYFSSVTTEKSIDSSIMSTEVETKSFINDEGRTMYTPVYTYEVNGVTYKCGSDYSSSSYPGDNKTVYYSSIDPSNCVTENSK